MVLDAKAMTWAAQHELDTAKLKKAGVPIYGKWYFPEIPAQTPMVNLETGEREVFPERMLTGEVIYVAEADLRRTGLVELPWPEVQPGPLVAEPGAGPPALAGVEPLLALSRPPEEVVPPEPMALALPPAPEAMVQQAEPATGIHMPTASVAPFVLAIGFCLIFLGVVANMLFFLVGVVWFAAGAIGWIRIGLAEARQAGAHAEPEADGAAAD